VSRALTAKSYCLTKREALVVEVTGPPTLAAKPQL
jgi:hypothetical protein